MCSRHTARYLAQRVEGSHRGGIAVCKEEHTHTRAHAPTHTSNEGKVCAGAFEMLEASALPVMRPKHSCGLADSARSGRLCQWLFQCSEHMGTLTDTELLNLDCWINTIMRLKPDTKAMPKTHHLVCRPQHTPICPCCMLQICRRQANILRHTLLCRPSH